MRMAVQDRRRALAAAALRVLERDGIARTTARAIVAEAGMSLASLHYAFASRDDVLRAAVALVVADERRALEGVLDVNAQARGPAALEALVRDGIACYLDTIDEHPGREHGMLELSLHAARSSATVDLAHDQYRRYRALARAMLTAAAEATSMRFTSDVDDLAVMVVAVCDGLTIARIVDGAAAPTALDRLVAALVTDAVPAAHEQVGASA